MGNLAEQQLRERVRINGGSLTISTDELYREFGVDGTDPDQRGAVAELVEGVGLEMTPVEDAASGSWNVTLREGARAPLADPVTPPATPASQVSVVQQQIVVGGEKSVGIAILLAVLFGPLGMLYATVPGALVMMLLGVVIGVVTLGTGLVLVWIVSIIWAGFAASSHNARLERRARAAAAQVPGVGVG